MRDIHSWRKNLVHQLRQHWPENGVGLTPRELVEVELGFVLLLSVAADENASALWVLLSGYTFPTPLSKRWNAEERQMMGNARHLLPGFRSASAWNFAVECYRSVPEQLRGFEVNEAGHFALRSVSLCSERFGIYTDALCHAIPHTRRPVKWAEAGEYVFTDRRKYVSVDLPQDFIFPPPVGHDLAGHQCREPLRIPWSELIETACHMDELEVERGLTLSSWEKRLKRVQLELWDTQSAKLSPTDTLTLDGLFHLIGMVSSGKSTLMDVLAVWAAKRGRHVTIVVSDVISVLNRSQQFQRLGFSVAPILGASNRKRHIERLHHIVVAEQQVQSLIPGHEGFRWLSTACPLDGLRRTNIPLELGEQPCTDLLAREGENDDGQVDETQKACPLYGVCPSHQSQRDLVDASIWIATPASLVYTRVAPQLNPERIHFAELVYRRSDLVIVDEADQVQVQLDAIFNPNQTLVSRGKDAWLGKLQLHVISKLNQEGCAPLGEEGVGDWCHRNNLAQTVQHRMYDLLLNSPGLRSWVEQDSYFTDLTLFHRLSQALNNGGTMLKEFVAYVGDPLGEQGEQELHHLAELTTTKNPKVSKELTRWVKAHTSGGVILSVQELARMTENLEFALLTTVLQHQIHYLIHHWRKVESPLGLEEAGSLLFHRPPEDYRSVLPEPPMGQVLAFQYVRKGTDASKPGDLRFFRCAGVGRWLLLHLHELWASDGITGPHVILLSGTSWAGSSPSYHLQAPVGGVLRTPPEEINAINESHFQFYPLVDDDTGRPINVSGLHGGERTHALQSLLKELAGRNGFGGPGLLEQERDSLPADRQRILLLVGSYDEAKRACDFLTNLRPDWEGQVRYLVPDDSDFESEWHGEKAHLQRGLVHQFAHTGAWILVAPLLAVERGHNILTETKDRAAVGAAYFLVRPHPHPDDINHAIHAINRWALEKQMDEGWLAKLCRSKTFSNECAGDVFRKEATRRWRELLRLPMRYSTLPDEERDAVTWSQLVTIWQVIGRLVRGGSPAHVFFCDAAFGQRTAQGTDGGDQASSSLLIGMKQVLRPYFETKRGRIKSESALVQTLYGPFYKALCGMGGIVDGTL